MFIVLFLVSGAILNPGLTPVSRKVEHNNHCNRCTCVRVRIHVHVQPCLSMSSPSFCHISVSRVLLFFFYFTVLIHVHVCAVWHKHLDYCLPKAYWSIIETLVAMTACHLIDSSWNHSGVNQIVYPPLVNQIHISVNCRPLQIHSWSNVPREYSYPASGWPSEYVNSQLNGYKYFFGLCK